MYRLWLDDQRDPPNEGPNPKGTRGASWNVVRSFAEFKNIVLTSGVPAIVSFDYDLTDDWADKKTKTGMACAVWLKEHIVTNGLRCPDFLVHSTNPKGAKKIRDMMDEFKNFWK